MNDDYVLINEEISINVTSITTKSISFAACQISGKIEKIIFWLKRQEIQDNYLVSKNFNKFKLLTKWTVSHSMWSLDFKSKNLNTLQALGRSVTGVARVGIFLQFSNLNLRRLISLIQPSTLIVSLCFGLIFWSHLKFSKNKITK